MHVVPGIYLFKMFLDYDFQNYSKILKRRFLITFSNKSRDFMEFSLERVDVLLNGFIFFLIFLPLTFLISMAIKCLHKYAIASKEQFTLTGLDYENEV